MGRGSEAARGRASPTRERRLTRHLVAVAVAALVSIACAGDEPIPQATETVSSFPPSPPCPDEWGDIAEGARRVGGILAGDVDGDGAEDKVSLFLGHGGREGCQASLVVEGASNLVLPVLKRGEVAGLTPSLHGLREIDGEPGLEIVVNEAAGASTQFVGVYRVGEEAIEQLRFPKGTAGLFAFGGSVGHLEAVDCSGRANVVVSSAVPAPGEGALEENLYRVGRIFINYEGSRPEVESKEIQRVPIEDLDRFPEYANSPFGSCAAP